MPTILKQILFDEGLLELVRDFDCCEDPANPKFWEEEINEWIRMDPSEEDGALFYIQTGTQVWLYADADDNVIGYGSLCGSNWPDPDVVVKVPKLKRVPISLIPAVGLDRRYQGGPPGAEKQQKYSRKIMRHLIREAQKHTDRQPFLGLFVHPQNQRAIDLYLKVHFTLFDQKTPYSHEKAGVDYPAYILKLNEYPHFDEE